LIGNKGQKVGTRGGKKRRRVKENLTNASWVHRHLSPQKCAHARKQARRGEKKPKAGVEVRGLWDKENKKDDARKWETRVLRGIETSILKNKRNEVHRRDNKQSFVDRT